MGGQGDGCTWRSEDVGRSRVRIRAIGKCSNITLCRPQERPPMQRSKIAHARFTSSRSRIICLILFAGPCLLSQSISQSLILL